MTKKKYISWGKSRPGMQSLEIYNRVLECMQREQKLVDKPVLSQII